MKIKLEKCFKQLIQRYKHIVDITLPKIQWAILIQDGNTQIKLKMNKNYAFTFSRIVYNIV